MNQDDNLWGVIVGLLAVGTIVGVVVGMNRDKNDTTTIEHVLYFALEKNSSQGS